MMPAPFFQDARTTLYHGDARRLARDLEVGDWRRVACITDPVWPNPGKAPLAGADDPLGLFADVIGALVARGLERLIVILGLDSDPRFLAGVPSALRFLRVTWLRLARPSYKGPILVAADVAYVFGRWPLPSGQRVFPGEIVATSSRGNDGRGTAHPCPRRPEHLHGLIRGYAREEDTILDPFAGSGTTLEQARRLGRRACGFELEERWCLEQRERASSGPLFAGRAS